MKTPDQIRRAARNHKQPAIRPHRLRAAQPRRADAETLRLLSLANTIKKPSSHTKTMSTQSPSKPSKTQSKYRVGMFSAGEARCDRWQEMAHAAQLSWPGPRPVHRPRKQSRKSRTCSSTLSILEAFHAYPGESLMAALKEALGRDDYSGFSKLSTRIAKAIITGSYRRSANAWKLGEEGEQRGQRAPDEGLLRHGRSDQALLRSPDR